MNLYHKFNTTYILIATSTECILLFIKSVAEEKKELSNEPINETILINLFKELDDEP